MSEVTKSITTLKVYDDQKDEVNSIANRLGNGAGQKEVMAYLLEIERAHYAKETGKDVPRLDDIRFHFSRIEGIFTEYVLSSRDREQMDAETIHQLTLTSEQQKLFLYDKKLEIETLREELHNIEEKHEVNLKQQQTNAEVERNQFKGEIALLKENHQKELDSLRELLIQTKEAKEQSDKLVRLTQEATESANQRLSDLIYKANEYDKLKEELSIVQEELGLVKASLSEKEIELKNTFDRINIEKDKGLFEVEKKYIEQISKLREELSLAREQYADLKIAFNEKK
ncbi:hypothetical protein [Paenibacillus elgii]|uniref:hypothetical protein n=1 Tax=Paenibacillus elgii TaxID=189691 RepID=UPI000248D64C|nr:hypothetical protein [Paenibacillus elgii]